ncbi:MAG: hypothetical protein FWG11_09555, partial [Promicromonosporaceae bacterium]|nr:hypothetical protein [Promicromonosporaceae bacterium]
VLGIWDRLTRLEAENHLKTIGPLDFALVEPVRRWANGKSLEEVLLESDIAPGDFVRWCKQVVDVLNQLAVYAPAPELREAARVARAKVLRGVVAHIPASLER